MTVQFSKGKAIEQCEILGEIVSPPPLFGQRPIYLLRKRKGRYQVQVTTSTVAKAFVNSASDTTTQEPNEHEHTILDALLYFAFYNTVIIWPLFLVDSYA